jgi:hypothetical protein
MTQQHPITPPEELVASMIQQAFNPLGATGLSNPDQLTGAFADLVTRAAQWGADQELEGCIDWMKSLGYWGDDGKAIPALRAARRPQPPSLKERALQALAEADLGSTEAEWSQRFDTIRRALEQLDD